MAGNPGKVLLHSQMPEHAAAGMNIWFEVGQRRRGAGIRGRPPASRVAGGRLIVSLASNDRAVLAAELQRYCYVCIVAVAPEPAVVSGKRGCDAAIT